MMILTLQGREGFANGQPWMPLRISSLPNRISALSHLASFASGSLSCCYFTIIWIVIQHNGYLSVDNSY